MLALTIRSAVDSTVGPQTTQRLLALLRGVLNLGVDAGGGVDAEQANAMHLQERGEEADKYDSNIVSERCSKNKANCH